MKLGEIEVGSVRSARLPAGTLVSDQRKVSRSPSTSVEPLPSSITVLLRGTVWSGPASATGGVLRVVIVT